MKEFAKALSLGANIIVSMLVPLFIGMYLDSKFNSKPICMFIGILFGVSLAFYSLYKMTKN